MRTKLTGCKAWSEVSRGTTGSAPPVSATRRDAATTAGRTAGRCSSPRPSSFRNATRQLTCFSRPKAVRQLNQPQTRRDSARRDKLGSPSTVC